MELENEHAPSRSGHIGIQDEGTPSTPRFENADNEMAKDDPIVSSSET